MMMVDGGFIHGVNASFWINVRNFVNHIVFSDTVTAGASLNNLFAGLPHLTHVSGLYNINTSNVTSMAGMFSNNFRPGIESLDLSGWDVSNVMNMNMMFSNVGLRRLVLCENFRFVGNSNLPSPPRNQYYSGLWTNGTHAFTSARLMQNFHGATMAGTWVWQLATDGTGTDVTAYGEFDVVVEDVPGAKWRLYSDGLLVVDSGALPVNASTRQDSWHVWNNVIERISFSGEITIAPGAQNSLFSGNPNLTAIYGLHYLDTSRVTSMVGMFSGVRGLTSLDLSSWDTGNVTSMRAMFNNARGLTSINVENWDMRNVTDISSMFSEAQQLTDLDVSRWDTGNIIYMNSVFNQARSLTQIAVDNWDTSSVTNMSRMFCSTWELTDLNLSGWDTGNVTNMFGMFEIASNLQTLDLSGWDTGRVTDMRDMFRGADELTVLNLSGWDTRNVTNMGRMFQLTNNLRQIILSENFRFGDATLLPNPPGGEIYTGRWTNGTLTFTAAELMYYYDGATMAGMWFWERHDGNHPAQQEKLRAQLEQIVAQATEILENTHISTDGAGVPHGAYWTPAEYRIPLQNAIQSAIDTLNAQ